MIDQSKLNVDLGPDGLMGAPIPEPGLGVQASTGATEAQQALDNLKRLLANPEFEKLSNILKDASDNTLKFIMQMPVATIGDIFQREQLFGEWRGLQRLAAELSDRKDEIEDQLVKEQATPVE